MSNFIQRMGTELIYSGSRKPFRMLGMNLLEPSGVNPFLADNELDYQLLHRLGFNAARIQMEYTWFEDDAAPYIYKSTGFDYLNKIIDMGRKYGVYTILDMHFPQSGFQSRDDSFWQSDNELQKRYICLWQKIADYYKDEDYVLCYDLLNEPLITTQEMKEKYDAVINRAISAIREFDKNHLIWIELPLVMIGGFKKVIGKDNDTRDYILEPPYLPKVIDHNVIYDFHMYMPLEFTHQGCVFADFNAFPPKVIAPGYLDIREAHDYGQVIQSEPVDYQVNRKDTLKIMRHWMESNIDVIRGNGFPCVVGEYGINKECIKRGAHEWVEDVQNMIDEYNLNFCYFSLRWYTSVNHFGFFERELQDIFENRYLQKK